MRRHDRAGRNSPVRGYASTIRVVLFRAAEACQATSRLRSRSATCCRIEHAEGVRFSWPSVSGWHFARTKGARGVLLDQGAHALDTICWWLGEDPSWSRACTDSFGGPEGVASLVLQNGHVHRQHETELAVKTVQHLPHSSAVAASSRGKSSIGAG